MKTISIGAIQFLNTFKLMVVNCIYIFHLNVVKENQKMHSAAANK